MEKQETMFGISDEPESGSKYSSGIKIPIYEPRGRSPHAFELCDKTKTARLVEDINHVKMPEDVRAFLMLGAQRHLVFNYELIADFYAHASAEVQQLMEDSALVIVDLDKAIEGGYVRLCEEIKSQYMELKGEADEE